jgi:hypothetical protein
MYSDFVMASSMDVWAGVIPFPLYNYNIGTNSGCNKFFAQKQARGIK